MKQKLSQIAVAGAVITLGLLPDVAEAQGPPPDPARRAELVKRFDADGDGVLSPEEIEAAHAARGGHGPKGDNKGNRPARKESDSKTLMASNDEMIERLQRRFDLDRNGKLNYEEMDALRAFTKTSSSRESESGVEAEHPHPHASAGGDDHE